MTWIIESDGVIYDKNQKAFGFFDVNGDVYEADAIAPFGQPVAPPVGLPVGVVDTAGEAYNSALALLGAVGAHGTLFNMGSLQAAKVDTNNDLRDLAGNIIASVRPSIHTGVHKPSWCPMPYRAAAALFFILLKRQ